MTLSSSLNLVSFVFYLSLVLYLLTKNPKPLLSRLCAAFVACFAFWTFTRIFVYNSYVSRSTAELFTNIGSLGWISYSSFFLWFALVFSGKKRILEKTYFYLFLFGIPLALIFLQWGGLIIVDFIKTAFGWRPIMGKSVWSFISFGYILSFMTVGLFLVFDVIRKSHGKRPTLKSKQARIIFFSTLIALLASVFTDILLPMMNIYRLPHLTGFYGLIWAAGLVYAMGRHKFLAIMPTASIDEIKDVLFNISEAVRRAVTLRQLLEIIQQQVDRLMDAKNFYVALVYDKDRKSVV